MKDANVSKKRSGQLIVYERKKKNTIDEDFVLKNTRDDTLKPYKLKRISYEKSLKHQKEGIAWFWNKHCKLGNKRNGILGDDMGLGKTKLVCTFLAGLFKSGLIHSVLIIVPKILMNSWEKELRREEFELGDKITPFDDYKAQKLIKEQNMGGTLKANIKIMSYERMTKNDDILGEGKEWDYLIFDEAHALKDPRSARYKSMRKIGTKHKILITGTPIENNLMELRCLYDICCPNILGSKREFRRLYVKDIERANNKNATGHQRSLGDKASKHIIEITKEFILRRTKEEVKLDMPKKREVLVWLRLTTLQKKIYKDCLIIDDKGAKGSRLAKMMEICNDLSILQERVADWSDKTLAKKMAQELLNRFKNAMKTVEKKNISYKINFIAKLVNDEYNSGQHILIFSESAKMLARIKEKLNLMNLKFYHIDGDTKDCLRTKYIEDFENDIETDRNIFLMAKQVGGVGITLVRANPVIVVDPSWNPSSDSQCVDRAYRIGQKREVIVYRFLTAGIIEENVFKLQTKKNWLFKMTTQHSTDVKSYNPLFDDDDEAFDTSITYEKFKIQQDKQLSEDEVMKELQDKVIQNGAIGLTNLNLIFKGARSILSPSSPKREAYAPKDVYWRKQRPTVEKKAKPSRKMFQYFK